MIEKKSKIIPYILTVLMTGMIIISTSSLVGVQLDGTKVEIGIILIAIIMVLTGSKRISVTNSIFYMSIYIFANLLIQCIYYPVSFGYIVRFGLLLVSIAVGISYANRHEIDYCLIFYKIVILITVLSSIMYIVVEILKISVHYTLFTRDWLNTYRNYFYIYFSRHMGLTDTLLGLTFTRNNGIFSEPGMYCLFLDFAVFVHLYIIKNKNKFVFAVLLFAIFTTSSTMGIIALMVMVAYYLAVYKNLNNKLLGGVLILMFSLMLLYIFKDMMGDKLLNHPNSYLSRAGDLTNGFILFTQRPWIGWGFRNSEVFINGLGNGRPNSNGVVTLLYQMGIAGALMYIIPCVHLYKYLRRSGNKKNIAIYCILIVTILLLTMGQPIEYSSMGIALLSLLLFKCNQIGKVSL